MSSRTKNIIILIAGLQIALAIGVLALPTIVDRIPAQYYDRLPKRITDLAGVRPAHIIESTRDEAEIEAEAENLLAELASSTTAVETAPDPTEIPQPTATVEPTAVPEVVVEAASEETAGEPDPTATTPPPTPTIEPTAEPPAELIIPPNSRISGLELEAQEFNNCGPTNLTIVLNYYGDATTQQDAATYLKPNNQDRNVSPWQISDYVNEETGLRSITRSNGTQEMLKAFVAAGYPVVVEKGYDPESANSEGWYGHYLTLFGYSDEAQEYYTMDTFLGPFRQSDVKEGYELEDGMPYSYEYIDYYWEQFNHTFYVVYPPEAEAEIYMILGEELLDDNTMWTAAAQRAQVTLETEPENQFAWFNLGTALTRLGELSGEQTYYENGAVAFDKARSLGLPSRMLWYQHRPYIAYMKTGRYDDMLELADATLIDPGGRNVEETYFYKGHALSFLGDLDGSADAYEQALKLNEFFYPAQFSLDYINSVR